MYPGCRGARLERAAAVAQQNYHGVSGGHGQVGFAVVVEIAHRNRHNAIRDGIVSAWPKGSISAARKDRSPPGKGYRQIDGAIAVKVGGDSLDGPRPRQRRAFALERAITPAEEN